MGIWLLDLNSFGLYLNKTVRVIIIKIYDRDNFFPANTCIYPPDKRATVCAHRPFEVLNLNNDNHYKVIEIQKPDSHFPRPLLYIQ
jgi:hypothetical protein